MKSRQKAVDRAIRTKTPTAESLRPSWDWQRFGAIPFTALVTAVAFFVPWSLTGVHATLGFDEGIYLHGAERILSGQHIYRDFFAVTGPGTFWLFAVWFRLFATSLEAAHALLSLELTAVTVSLYLVTGKFVSRVAGVTAASSFVALLMAFTHRLYVNHRWDSASCIVIATTLAVLGLEKPVFVFAGGFFAGCAAVFTPPTLLAAFALGGCLLAARQSRRQGFVSWPQPPFRLPLPPFFSRKEAL